MQTAKPMPRARLQAMAETALLVGVGFALSYITLFKMPYGGSVTPFSLLPLLLIGQRHGPYWAFSGAVVFGGLQILQQFWAPPVENPLNFFLVVALDYIIAFGAFGFSFLFRKRRYGLLLAAPLCYILRFLCHFISGIVVWESFMPDTFTNVWIYSAVYNAGFLSVDMAFVMLAGFYLCHAQLVQFRNPNRLTA